MPVSRFLSQWLSLPQGTPDLPRQERTLAVLISARSLIGRGWLQGGWYVLEGRDGRRRFVGPGSLTPRGDGTVARACLVGAVVEAARWHSAQRGTAGPAIDALWRTLVRAEGRRIPPDVLPPSPAARGLRARALASWNDHPDRTRSEVLRLLDTVIDEVMADVAAERAALPPGPDRADDASMSRTSAAAPSSV